MADFKVETSSKIYHKGVIPLSSFTFKQINKVNLGINIEEKKKDITMIFNKKQLKSIVKEGLDPQEVLQEIFKGILIRNKGKCPYDPEKSAFSTYVVMVMNCVVMNVVNKHRKTKSRYMTGKEEDVATSYNASYICDPSDKMFLQQVRSSFQGDNLKVYDALMEGYKRSHLVDLFGWKISKINKIVNNIKIKVAKFIGKEIRC
mgnify:CR=1 FL=1